jgi:ribonuclease R
MRARYAVEALGHYGLAKAKYAHFTSPIRRYADLVLHRCLFEDQKNKVQALTKTAEHLSSTERNSADAERDSKSVKLYAYLELQLKSENPERYSAMVTDIRNFGVFVDVMDLGMGGLVPLSLLDDDFYEFDPARMQVTGRRYRRVIKLGDIIEVVVGKVDSFKKQVDFRLVPVEGAQIRPKRKRPSGKESRNRKDKGKGTGSKKPHRKGLAKIQAKEESNPPAKKRRKKNRHKRKDITAPRPATAEDATKPPKKKRPRKHRSHPPKKTAS